MEKRMGFFHYVEHKCTNARGVAVTIGSGLDIVTQHENRDSKGRLVMLK